MLLLMGFGAMIDFGTLLSNPSMFLYGVAAQFGIFAFVTDTIGGCLFVKVLNIFRKKKVNPMIGGSKQQ